MLSFQDNIGYVKYIQKSITTKSIMQRTRTIKAQERNSPGSVKVIGITGNKLFNENFIKLFLIVATIGGIIILIIIAHLQGRMLQRFQISHCVKLL